jgi:nicotinamide-nucleotide amidase
MIGEIIAIGNELTSGRITNTTSTFAARQLFAAGHEIYAMHTIGDTPNLIGEALKRAIKRVDFVIVSGGLGVTSDDLTNEAVAEALDRPATLNEEILEEIRSQLQGEQDEQQQTGLEKLAWLPEGAEVLNAGERMAGHLLIHESTPVFFLPGVPEQARKLLADYVLPRLVGWSRDNRNHSLLRIYKTVGLAEYTVNQQLLKLEQLPHVSIGYYPVGCEVHVSLTVSGADSRESEQLFQDADQRICQSLGHHIYGIDQQTLAQVVGQLLLEQNLYLATAESCTGGLIGAKITMVPGSSDWFLGGVIAYSNQLKEILLNVDHALLRSHGAVSPQVAMAMAARLADRVGCKTAVSVTGIAGPGGGTAEKPIGTVYIGLLHKGRVSNRLHHFSGNRKKIQEKTALTALNTVRLALLGQDENNLPR